MTLITIVDVPLEEAGSIRFLQVFDYAYAFACGARSLGEKRDPVSSDLYPISERVYHNLSGIVTRIPYIFRREIGILQTFWLPC